MGKKEAQVRDGVLEHLEAVQRTVTALGETTTLYLDGDDDFVDRARRVHDLETEADTIRKRTERVLFEGAFLPSHREDYFVLLERLDEVADMAEDTANHVVLTRPEVPDDLAGDVRGMVDELDGMSDRIAETVRMLFEDTSRIEGLVEELKTYEERVDDAEFTIVEQLFASDVAGTDKLLVKDMVEMLARVTDMIEDVGDHIAILVVKRRA